MFCGKCGAPVEEGAVVCSSCGEVIASVAAPADSAPVAESAPIAEPTPVQAQPVYQQPVYQQPVYQQPVYQQPVIPEGYSETVSMGEWIGSMLLMMIPVVNFILILVWAFGGTKKSKSNYFKACLILYLICFVIAIIAFVLMFAVFGMSASDMAMY